MVDDAMALVRVMVEKVINAQYIFLAGTDTALDYIYYLEFRDWRDYEDLKTVAPELAPNYTVEMQKELKKASENAKHKILPDGSKKSRFGRGHDWIDISLSKRALFVDEQIDIKLGKRGSRPTQVLYHTAYKKSAGYLHGTWISVVRSLKSEKREDSIEVNGMVEMSLGIKLKDASPTVAKEAMNISNLTAMAMLLFIAKVFATEGLP
jgi:hypothetical protein